MSVEDGRKLYIRKHAKAKPEDEVRRLLKAEPNSVDFGALAYLARQGNEEARDRVRTFADRGNVMAQNALTQDPTGFEFTGAGAGAADNVDPGNSAA